MTLPQQRRGIDGARAAHDHTRSAFTALFARAPDVLASAPGRVNLLGEHTDYNGGFVLPTAVPLRTIVAVAERKDHNAFVYSATLEQRAAYLVGREQSQHSWVDHVQGATRAAVEHGYALTGFEAWLDTELPLGSGLSSSAALSVAVLRALRGLFAWTLDDIALAKLAQWGENEIVGAPVGILDPLACQLADETSALFIDTRTLQHERLPLPATAELVVIDSGVRHSHASGEYGQRRIECAAAARELGVKELRDVSLDRAADMARLPAPLNRRARHVVTENERVLAGVDALRAGDAVRLGQLFDASHESMRHDFEVSIPEVDRIVEAAGAIDDVFGARLTGGGFGGAVICLVRKGSAEHVARALSEHGASAIIPPLQEHAT